MRGEAAAPLGREHVLGQRVLRCHVPVWLDLRRIGVLVRVRALGNSVSERNLVEAVQLAPIVRSLITGIRVIEILGQCKRHFAQLDRAGFNWRRAIWFLGDLAGRRPIRSWEGREEIVERTVLLNDDHDVLDRARRAVRIGMAAQRQASRRAGAPVAVREQQKRRGESQDS